MFGLGDNHKLSNDDPAMLDTINQLTAQVEEELSYGPQQHTTVGDSAATQPRPIVNDITTISSPLPMPNHGKKSATTTVVPQAPLQPTFNAAHSGIVSDDNATASNISDDTTTAPASKSPGSATVATTTDDTAFHISNTTDVAGDAEATTDVDLSVSDDEGDAISRVQPEQASPDYELGPKITTTKPQTIGNSIEKTSTQSKSKPAHNGTHATTTGSQSKGSPDTESLARMKQRALEQLETLVEYLDQSPEETFKTTMMMIQASDNHTLLEKAMQAAESIPDEKVRAKAMLDIVNEINYFAQLSK